MSWHQDLCIVSCAVLAPNMNHLLQHGPDLNLGAAIAPTSQTGSVRPVALHKLDAGEQAARASTPDAHRIVWVNFFSTRIQKEKGYNNCTFLILNMENFMTNPKYFDSLAGKDCSLVNSFKFYGC